MSEVEEEGVIQSPGKLKAHIGNSSAPRPLSACAMLWTALRFAVDVSGRASPASSGGLSLFHALVLPLLLLMAVLLPGRVPGLAPSAALMTRGLSHAMRQPASAGRPLALGLLLDLALMLGVVAAVARRMGRAREGSSPVWHAHRYDWRSLVSMPGPEEEMAVLAAAIGLAAAAWTCGMALALIRPG